MSQNKIGTPLQQSATKVLFLGSGELCKEMVIEAQRLGIETIAVDSYENAPAMQVAHRCHVIDMKNGNALRAVIKLEQPDLVVPEIEAINTDTLVELEKEGVHIIPTANAAHLTMDREGIRRLAAETLKLPTAKYLFAETLEEFQSAVREIGLPCVTKPIMSSSGKGQSVIKNQEDIEKAWKYGKEAARGNGAKMIVEEFITFDYEITLLTVRTAFGTKFCEPIGHIQINGDYHESWQPCTMTEATKQQSRDIAKKVTDALGGYGIFGVELFIKDGKAIFSEVSPRPHDTGMVTMATQVMSEFELHIRAILGLPVNTTLVQTGATHVIKAANEHWNPTFDITEAVQIPDTKIRLFGKPLCKPGRRMGVVLATASTIDEARAIAEKTAHLVKIE
ncbi:MAG: formate-dependent phosphoribosylglycinamide formyltransferase [Bacteroidota bacterium]|nr:formate-dependent phosphoribosylglycinamide formyltransferase [Bacteroidota bacterium]